MKLSLCSIVIVSLLAAMLPACADPPAQQSPPAPGFSADATEAGGSVSLRAVSVTAEHLVVEVVARDVRPLYGVAFRLSYDPAVLRFASTLRGPSWPEGSVELAKEAAPGLLVSTVSAKGDIKGLDEPEAIVSTLTFDRLARTETKLGFVTTRSTAFTTGGAAARARFTGGTLR